MSSGLTTYDDSDAFVDSFLADPSQSYTPTDLYQLEPVMAITEVISPDHVYG